MTRDQAAELVSAALAAAGRYDQILSADAFAQRFAVALDALGLLHFAHDPQRSPDVTDRVGDHPDANEAAGRTTATADVSAEADRLIAKHEGYLAVDDWATKRSR